MSCIGDQRRNQTLNQSSSSLMHTNTNSNWSPQSGSGKAGRFCVLAKTQNITLTAGDAALIPRTHVFVARCAIADSYARDAIVRQQNKTAHGSKNLTVTDLVFHAYSMIQG